MKKLIISLIIVIFPLLHIFAQEQSEEPDTNRRHALKVYMTNGDMDYIRREISFVNYVRDLKDARIYIITTSQRTGAGGTEYTYFLTGQHEFKGMVDTIRFTSSPNNTYEETRQGRIHVLKLGLMRYVVRTPLANRINIDFSEPEVEELVEDKWKSWVFRTNISGFLNGQKTIKSSDIFGSISASKVTPDWKIDFDLDFSNGKDEFDFGDGDIIKSENRSQSFDALIVKSINDHWSVGGNIDVSSSTYSNYKLRTSFYPGIEYDIFPYSESTRKQLTILYSAGYSFNNYEDTTIYDKVKESLFGHKVDVGIEVIQKWGSISASITWRNYFHNWRHNNLSLHGSFNFRVLKGLTFNLGGGGSIIHDQLSLVKGGATQEEILLRRKEIATSFSYFTHFGITYTFGSIYNNVVNPRFGGGGGGRMIIMM